MWLFRFVYHPRTLERLKRDGFRVNPPVMNGLLRTIMERPIFFGGPIGYGVSAIGEYFPPAEERAARLNRAGDTTVRTTIYGVFFAGAGAILLPLEGRRVPRIIAHHAVCIGTLAAATVEIGKKSVAIGMKSVAWARHPRPLDEHTIAVSTACATFTCILTLNPIRVGVPVVNYTCLPGPT
jgi:hypothetical protein